MLALVPSKLMPDDVVCPVETSRRTRYEATSGAPGTAAAAASSGYMDVPAPSGAATGYTDVAPGFGGDDDAEDV